MNNPNIAVIGLGYVGLPLSIEFSKFFKVIGYDIDAERVNELVLFHDKTQQVSDIDLRNSKIQFSSDLNDIHSSNIYIVTVPTPVTTSNIPNLDSLISATYSIGEMLHKKNIVIYESTVYPGCTEEKCVPILEQVSGLKYNKDFYCGYSPERINPGDNINTLTTIKKVTSGSNKKASKIIDNLYNSIITAGTHLVSSIKIAEAAKVIENCQRDLNISFVNELALIFDRLDIDTNDVLDAASTKWNFIDFRPGLVGGHCICVDPYYLKYISEKSGYFPEVISSGRNVNANMHIFITEKLIKLMELKSIIPDESKVLIYGFTFKENCPDIRNAKVIDIVNELRKNKIEVDVIDEIADSNLVKKIYGINLITSIDKLNSNYYDSLIIAVPNIRFNLGSIKLSLNDKRHVIYDIKGFLDKKYSDARL